MRSWAARLTGPAEGGELSEKMALTFLHHSNGQELGSSVSGNLSWALPREWGVGSRKGLCTGMDGFWAYESMTAANAAFDPVHALPQGTTASILCP